jgi:hypothetical protein
MAAFEVLGGQCDIQLTCMGLMPDSCPAHDANVAEKRHNKESRKCFEAAGQRQPSPRPQRQPLSANRMEIGRAKASPLMHAAPTKERAAVAGQRDKGHRNITGCQGWNSGSAGQEKLNFRLARGRSG